MLSNQPTRHNYPKHRVVIVADINARRKEILGAIENFIAKHGYAPTMRELADLIGISAHSSISHNIAILRQRGFLTCAESPNGQMITRTMNLTEKGKAHLNGQSHNDPR